MDLEALKVALKKAGFSPFVRRGRAASRGSEAHDVLEALARGQDPEQVAGRIQAIRDEEVRGYAWAAFHFWRTELPNPILVEQPVVSLRHGFAGTLDLYALRETEARVLTDAKTSKAIYPEHLVQLAGYDIAVREMGYETPDEHSILLLRPDGSHEEHFVEIDHESFLHALELWHRVQAITRALREARKGGK